jgi:hypothetical protein
VFTLVLSYLTVAAGVPQPQVVDAPSSGGAVMVPNAAGAEDYSWIPELDLVGEKAMLAARPDTSSDLPLVECEEAIALPVRSYEVCDLGGSLGWGPWDGSLVFSRAASPVNIESLSNWQPTLKADFSSDEILLTRSSVVTISSSRYFSVSINGFDLQDCNAGRCHIEFSVPDSSSRLCSARLIFTSYFCGGVINVGNAANKESSAQKSSLRACGFSSYLESPLHDAPFRSFFFILASLMSLLLLFLRRRV